MDSLGEVDKLTRLDILHAWERTGNESPLREYLVKAIVLSTVFPLGILRRGVLLELCAFINSGEYLSIPRYLRTSSTTQGLARGGSGLTSKMENFSRAAN